VEEEGEEERLLGRTERVSIPQTEPAKFSFLIE